MTTAAALRGTNDVRQPTRWHFIEFRGPDAADYSGVMP
jgi:hypothetical protein